MAFLLAFRPDCAGNGQDVLGQESSDGELARHGGRANLCPSGAHIYAHCWLAQPWDLLAPARWTVSLGCCHSSFPLSPSLSFVCPELPGFPDWVFIWRCAASHTQPSLLVLASSPPGGTPMGANYLKNIGPQTYFHARECVPVRRRPMLVGAPPWPGTLCAPD